MTTLSIAGGIVMKRFGGNGGDSFGSQFVRSLALRTGGEVDAVIINDQRYGGDGGDQTDTLYFDDDEYINKVYIRADARVDNLKFVTNKGREIQGGGNGGNYYELTNIRVVAIGGRCASRLDCIDITYVDDYKPSITVQRRGQFVIGFTPPNTILKEYTDALYKTTDSYQNITETMLNQTYSASAEAEYYAKVAVSTEIQYKNTSTTTVMHELSQELRTGKYKETNIGPNQVGVLLVDGEILRGSNGKTWMFPTTSFNYATLTMDDPHGALNHYDLTGELATQMTVLKKYMVEKDGYVFYQG